MQLENVSFIYLTFFKLFPRCTFSNEVQPEKSPLISYISSNSKSDKSAEIKRSIELNRFLIDFTFFLNSISIVCTPI